jgi:hypothetical protein
VTQAADQRAPSCAARQGMDRGINRLMR